MAKGVTTFQGREKLCKAHAGVITLPSITQIALGTGGVHENGTVIEPTGEETALINQVLKREADSITFPVSTTGSFKLCLGTDELVGSLINEIGLYDSEGDLVMYKTFSSKGKDNDESITFDIEEVF